MAHGYDIRDRLDLAKARACLGGGDDERVVRAVVTALAASGWIAKSTKLGPLPPIDPARAYWLVLIGIAIEDGYGAWLVPESELDAPMRAALDACDNATIEPLAVYDTPELAHAYGQIGVRCGTVDARHPACRPRRGEPPLIGEADRIEWSGAWRSYGVSLKTSAGRSRLAVRLTRIVNVFESL